MRSGEEERTFRRHPAVARGVLPGLLASHLFFLRDLMRDPWKTMSARRFPEPVSGTGNLTRIPDRHSPSASRLRFWYRTTGSISSYVAGPVRMMIVPTPAFTIILEQRKQGQICVSSPVSTSYPAR